MSKVVHAAIDVGMEKLVVAIQGQDTVLEFANDAEGHRSLRKALKNRRVKRVGIEPTGNYGFDVMLALAHANFEIMSINPRASRAYAKASMKRAKTDRVDALMLLSFVMKMEFVLWQPPRTAVIELRAVSRRIQQLVKMVAAERARLKAARATGVTPEVVLESLEQAIAAVDAAIEGLVDAGLEIAAKDAELAEAIKLLISVKGVAERTAVKLLGELATLPSDLTERQLVAMTGLDPKPIESGLRVGQRRISKMGNAHIRGILYMAAHNAVRWEPVVGKLYQDLVGRGKHHMKAMVAVMRKLVHTLWGMLKTKTAFNPEKFRGTVQAAAA